MLSKNRTRIVLSVASAVLITLALGRCSPIAPSISKNGFNSGNLPTATQEGGAQPVDAPVAKSAANFGAIKGPYATVVPDSAESHISALVADPTALDQTHLEEFKNTGATDITIPDELAQREIHVAFKVDLTADAVTTQHLDTFEVKLDRKLGETWTMRAKTPGPLAQTVQDHLLGISVTIQTDAN